MTKKKTIEIEATTKGFPQAQSFIEQVLESNSVNSNIASETMLLFEALFNAVISQVEGANTTIEMVCSRKLGRTELVMYFPGERFSPPECGVEPDPDAKIIEAFADKVSYSYRSGYNEIRISVSVSAKAFLLPNLVAVAMAFIIGIPLTFVLDAETAQTLSTDWLDPLQKLFTNAVMMIGAPMTLFSLLKNTTDAFIVSGHKSSSRRLFLSSLITSIAAIILAVILGFAVSQLVTTLIGAIEGATPVSATFSLASVVDQIIPSNILEPFQTISPIPMIIVALLITYGLFSVGKNFELIQSAIDACYDLFSRILNIVMALFPIACFAFFLKTLLTGGVIEVVALLILVAVVLFLTLFLFLSYAIRLKFCGYKLLEFWRTLKPLIKENFKIGSAIDAVPYNVRYCTKNFGFSRDRLEKELPVLAQTNLDGNCFIIMLLAVTHIFLSSTEIAWVNIVVIGIIVLFLSFGAPNQPGSILIGMMIVFTYLDEASAIPMAMCFELFCGSIQNIINVISGIVTVAEDESKALEE